MKRLTAALTIIASFTMMLHFDPSAWNIPGHMLSGAIAYQILQRESQGAIAAVGIVPRRLRIVLPLLRHRQH